MSIHRPKITATARLLIGVAVGGVATALRARSAPPQTERPAFADPAGDRYRVTLSGGTTFEVVGILKDYKTWYRPDGTPLDESPADPSGDAYSVKAGEEHQTILVRVKNLPKDATLKWVPTYDQGCGLQFRPFEIAEIKDIALNPRSSGNPTLKTERPQPETRPKTASSTGDPTADSDGDGLSDFQEIHKYRTDPKMFSTAADGVADGDRQRRREFTYSIRSVVKVMPPVNLECLDDDYQDARVLSRGENFVELEVIHYPLNTNADAIRGNPDWRRDAASRQEYVRPGITTNWDDAMRRELISALKAGGIDPDRLDDKELFFGRVHDDGLACPGIAHAHGPGNPNGRRQRPRAVGDGRERHTSSAGAPNVAPGALTSQGIRQPHVQRGLRRGHLGEVELQHARTKHPRRQPDGLAHAREHVQRPVRRAAGRNLGQAVLVFKADGHPEVHGRITTSSITWQSRNLHEIEIIIPREEYARMKPAVQYTIVPPNDVSGYIWKIKEPVTIMKKP